MISFWPPKRALAIGRPDSGQVLFISPDPCDDSTVMHSPEPNRSAKPDILDRSDIERLVDAFYADVRADAPLGHVFDEVAKVNWETHLPKICDFWESVLFRAGRYHGNMIRTHADLVAKVGMEWSLFERWLGLFRATVNRLFQGENSVHIVRCAEDMARVVHSKIHAIPNPRFFPLPPMPKQTAR